MLEMLTVASEVGLVVTQCMQGQAVVWPLLFVVAYIVLQLDSSLRHRSTVG